MKDKIIKLLFAIRVILWIVALIATWYWISWSFKLYDLGYMDETIYAQMLRPVFGKGLLISFLAIVASFLVRAISNNIKKKNNHSNQ